MDVLVEVPDAHATKSQAAHCHTALTNEKNWATAAVLQHLSLSALLGYIHYILSCLPQSAGELMTPWKTRKGEMGNCRLCPMRKRLLLQGKPQGGQPAVTGQGWQEVGRPDYSQGWVGWQPPWWKTEAALATSNKVLLLLRLLGCLPSSFIFPNQDFPSPILATSSQVHPLLCSVKHTTAQHALASPVYSTFPVRQRCVLAWQATVLHH